MPEDFATHKPGSPLRRLTTGLLGRRWPVFIESTRALRAVVDRAHEQRSE